MEKANMNHEVTMQEKGHVVQKDNFYQRVIKNHQKKK